MENEGFNHSLEMMGEITPKNEGFTWVPMAIGFGSRFARWLLWSFFVPGDFCCERLKQFLFGK